MEGEATYCRMNYCKNDFRFKCVFWSFCWRKHICYRTKYYNMHVWFLFKNNYFQKGKTHLSTAKNIWYIKSLDIESNAYLSILSAKFTNRWSFDLLFRSFSECLMMYSWWGLNKRIELLCFVVVNFQLYVNGKSLHIPTR